MLGMQINRSDTLMTGKRLERVSCFVFGLLVGWTLSWGSIRLKMIF